MICFNFKSALAVSVPPYKQSIDDKVNVNLKLYVPYNEKDKHNGRTSGDNDKYESEMVNYIYNPTGEYIILFKKCKNKHYII